MHAHVCSTECGHGRWKPGYANKYRVVQPVRGKITLDVLDEEPDHDANAYKDYEEDD
jgi:hypothetical protein